MNNLWILDNILRKGERKGKEQDIEKEKKRKAKQSKPAQYQNRYKTYSFGPNTFIHVPSLFLGVINHYTTLYVLVLVVAALAVALAPAVGVAVVGVAFVVVVVVA